MTNEPFLAEIERLMAERGIEDLDELYAKCTINLSLQEFKRHAAGRAQTLRGEFTRCVAQALDLSRVAEALLVLCYLGVGRYSDS
jgi:hypothetical protein